jgi:hypothetical protein
MAAPGVAFGQGQTVTPTTFADGDDQQCTPQHCTLREAANTFTSDRMTINLLPGTYEVTLGSAIPVQGVKTINGAGATIDANNLSSAVAIVEGADAIINDVTITGGNADAGQSLPQSGGGISIDVATTLTLNRSTVAGNHAGANGGGIYNDSNGQVVITDSTISGNTVGIPGTGGDGAGVYGTGSSDMDIFNSTVSGNQTVAGRLANGAGIAALGSLDLVHVTIAGNVPASTAGTGSSLAIASSQNPSVTASIWNSIVAADTGAACLITRTRTGDHNLDNDGTCGFSGVGDKPGVNPMFGPLQNNGGPTNTQLPVAGSPAIDAADAPHCLGLDQRGVVRPQLAACDMGAAEYVQPPPPPAPPAGQNQELPPPVAGKNVNAIPKSGTVRIKLPGRNRRFRKLVEGEQIPLGTTIDTLKGRVTLVAAANKTGKTATADFYDGIFKVLQTKGAKPITRIVLTEKLSCGQAGKAGIAAKRKKRRRVWGDGSGRFRTEGEFSSATVRGTKWLVQDGCASTLTRVVRGKVAVRDFVKKKTVIVRAGKRYVARRRP